MSFNIHLTGNINTPNFSIGTPLDIVNAWFLGDVVVCTGMLLHLLQSTDMGRYFDFEGKLDYLINNSALDDVLVQSLIQTRKSLSKIRKIKYKDRGMIIALEKVKKAVDDLFAGEMEQKKAYFEIYGYTKVVDLINQMGNIGFFASELNNFERKGKGIYPYSEAFLNTIDDFRWKPQSTFPLRSSQLVYHPDIQDKWKAEFGPEYEPVKPVFLFRLPHILRLEISELKVLKLRHDDDLEPVREAIVQLAQKALEGNGPPQDLLADMEENLKVKLTTIREKLLNDPLCRLLQNAEDNPFYTDLYVGLVPHHFNWVLEKLHHSFPEETLAVMEGERKKETGKMRWVPYILMVPKLENGPWEDALTEPEWRPFAQNVDLPEEEDPDMSRKFLDI
ncbi:MAG TPA: hypothetical protein PKY12_00290 [Catalimonadaceae bacterium]|nr:hypothetical protein [Catalimonadaceae bacterium]